MSHKLLDEALTAAGASGVAKQRRPATALEEEYEAELEFKCEYCGKAFEKERSRFQHQTGICPKDGKPWCPLAHREQTEEEYEIECIIDVRGAPAVGQRYYLVKWRGYDGDPMEESTWESAEDMAETAASAVDDFWAAHPELDRGQPHEMAGGGGEKGA
eukprot:COSAG05_NODE_1569_length_4530_cov_2.165877_5_plen_159_part_00